VIRIVALGGRICVIWDFSSVLCALIVALGGRIRVNMRPFKCCSNIVGRDGKRQKKENKGKKQKKNYLIKISKSKDKISIV